MRVALYARVSTDDRDQEPETQLVQLRDLVQREGWEIAKEYVDKAPATDLRRRTRWRELVGDAQHRRFDLLLVWRLDRAFRSVMDAATYLQQFRSCGVDLKVMAEPWIDTTTPFGEALYYITVAFAQLERGVLRQRVQAGMDRARRQGKVVGRPRKPIPVEKVFDAFAEHKTVRATARALTTELGVRVTPGWVSDQLKRTTA